MMNLGDGLVFELENGKPRLVLAKYGAESKSSNKKSSCRIPPRKNPQKIINSRQGPPQPDKAQQDRKSKGSVGQSLPHGPRGAGAQHSTSSAAARVMRETDPGAVTRQRESVVCLTQEQFQQILSTINSSSTASAHTHTETVASSEETCHGATEAAEALIPDAHHHKHRVSDRELLSDGPQSGFFSTFGERERGREKLEARKAQWKRELDEQMALKRQQKASLKDKAHDGSSNVRLKHPPDTEGMSTRPAERTQSQRELPAAIRSAFRVGEAGPVEDMFNAQREEQQRRWLQELDQQRKEDKLRRQQDKEMNSQAEDMERWAVHFDSLLQPSAVPDPSSGLSPHRPVSGARATARDGVSVCGGRASVDTTQGVQQRSSHLRTMTALLDPAQIEERDRRRLKQLEHQRAIEAQVEERRRQKEKEDATRRAQEQEEERRVERDRERLQQQYITDTERQKHKEEVQSRKTEELYLSIQRAQEEAVKDRHVQRVRDLAQKGHDVSKLLHSLEGDSAAQALSGPALPAASSKSQTQSTTPPRKHTAVQTEISHQPENDCVGDPDKRSAAAVTHTALDVKRSHHSEVKHPLRTAHRAAGADPYEAYARRPQKRPEWNTLRPSKAFVPASERYPEALKRHRQESRRLRQIQLMTLMERNTHSHTPQPEPLPPAHTPQNHRPQPQSENPLQDPSVFSAERGMPSPPITPVVKTRVHQDTGRPLSSDYVPYVRSHEVYQLDPLSRHDTHEAQHRVHTGLVPHEPGAPESTERQQAILKGLSQLRQALLQRQRELEPSLSPALQTQHTHHFSPFRPV
ncbi:coiled-coil domain-containing protein 66 [Rhinichthys klamathensis goyatoka]|uniref:coiled-coil domain-containing protein 66 n=1 Tax=Rhinichthys klamathensis goyatoka TaxID=3034132 RepID=UPI0024B5D2B4|nr:coiled-coil domain-containing protein 66 [Rhinichthys klamathensis goyatoka]